MNVDFEESFVLPTPPEDAYPASTYTIQAPEDPVFFAGQQVEPVTPSPEDPTGSGLAFYITDIVPIPASEAEGLSDVFVPTDPSGAVVPSSTSVSSIFPNVNIPYEGGTVCNVTGVALDAVAYVRILGHDILFVVNSPTWIQFTAPLSPDAAPGVKSVDFFDVYNVLLASYNVSYDPQIVSYGLTGVSASSGTILGNDVITIFGTALYYIQSVTICGQPVLDFKLTSYNTIEVVTAPGAFTGIAGDITVRNYDGVDATLFGAFTYTYPAPFILGLSKNSGDVTGGTQIEIAGAYFSGTTSVTIGGVPVDFFMINSSTSLIVFTAPGTYTGLVLDVVVTSPNGSGTLPGAFKYTTTDPVPMVQTVSASRGFLNESNTITISGQNFFGATSVLVGGVGAVSFSIVSNTKITAVVTSAGPYAGLAETVTVVNPYGSGSRAGSFTYLYRPPTVTSTTLTSDLVEGGTNGTLYGTNFYNVTAVTLAGVSVASFTVVSPTQINYVTGTSPNSFTNGAAQVITDFGTAALEGVFSYVYPTVTISNTSTNTGFASGGTTIIITGTGFTLVTNVIIAGIGAVSFTVNSLTQITAITDSNPFPTNLPGDVTVLTTFSQAVLPNAFTYVPSMFLTSSSVSSGVTTGGESGTLTGSQFANIANVLVVGTAVQSFTVVNSNTITFVTGATGQYGVLGSIVIVTTFNEYITLPNAFTYYPPLIVTSVGGPSASGIDTGGESRTISGSGFYSVTSVLIGGVPVQSFTVTSTSNINIVTAPSASIGQKNVTVVTNYLTQTLTNGFTYYPNMVVGSLSTSSGTSSGGTTVVITGSGFFSVNSVTFNGTAVSSFVVNSLTQITVVTASKVLSDGELGDVVVSSPFDSSTLSSSWTYWPPMSVASLNISNGSRVGGTTVVIAGSGFYAVADVTFNGVSVASYTVDSPSQITVVTAAGVANGTGNVVVSSIYTSATKTNAWTYWPVMSLTSSDVSNGSTVGGTTVVITGAGFFSVSSVTFNGIVASSFTVDSLTQITAVTSSKVSSNGDVGNIVVTSPYTSATKTNAWTYWPPMAVTSLSVSNGSTVGGTSVVITGSGFYSVSSVTFNGVAVSSFTVNSVTQITVTTAAGTSNGMGNVVVSSSYTSATGTNLWTYWQPLVVASLDVSNGPRAGGTTVVVTGSGFYSVSGVTFNGVAVSSYTVDSLTQITVVTGAKVSSTGDVGNVVVTSLYTSGTGTNLWTYYPPVVVSSLDVSDGPRAGGTTVVITGSGFFSVTGITFKGDAVTSFTIDSLTQITVVTGPGTSNGTGNVVVTSSYTSATGSNLWTYWPVMTVGSLDVTYGPKAGGTTVVITGTGFYGTVSSVTFNGVSVTSFTVDSLTQITVTTAAKPASNGDVGSVVVTSNYTSATKASAWTYYPPMSFTSIDVANGITTGGTAVVVTGAGFYNISSVTFDGINVASFTVDSLTQITVSTGVSSVTSPTLGNVVITSPYTSATGTNVWTYYPPIVVSSLDVTYGPVSGGTTVNITGSGFYSVSSVTFKGIEVRSKTVNSPTSMTVVVKGDVTQLVGKNSYLGTSPPTTNFIGSSTFGCWAGGSIQKFIVPGTYVYTSNDAVTFTVANVSTPGQYRYAMYVPSLSKAFVVGNGNFADRFLESTDGIAWTSPGVIPFGTAYNWNWMAYSPSLDIFVAVNRPSSAIATPFGVSTDRGATWTLYGTGTNRSFATVVWCAAMGKFVASASSVVNPGIMAYSSDGITWTEIDLATSFPTANVGIGQTASVSEDLGIVWFGSGGNSFTSSDGINWQSGTVASQINNPIWISSLQLFVGIKNATTYSYSPDGLTWTDVSANGTGVTPYGGLAYSPELDIFLVTSTGSNYNFTNPLISVNNSVVVTSTYTTGTKTNAWAFVPTMAISDVDIGYGPTAGGTVIKVYGRGFRNINAGSVTLKGVQAASFTVDSNGCLITVTTAAGTAGTGNIVCANSFRTATLTNGWSYKDATTSSYALDTLSSGALSSVQLAFNVKPVLSTYSGPLLRVWRDSDGAWTDVYGTSGNSTDWFTKNGVALATYKSTANLRVVRWFDQSGNATGSDGAIPKPPNSGPVFGYQYQIRYMPTLDLTANCLDFSGGSRYMQIQNSVTTAGDVAYTITVRHGTTGNSTNGEFFNIGTNSTTYPGNGNYLRRSGSDYVNNWPGNSTLTLTGAYADNQTVTILYDKTGLLRTGYVQATSAGTSAVTTAFAGDNTSSYIGGRGAGPTLADSLAQYFHFHVALSAMNASDRVVFEDLTALAPPVVNSVDVPSGTTAGGTTVVITGTGFLGTTAVTFKGTSAASFTVDSATQITALTAAGSAGQGDVVVTKPSGTSTFANGWTYVSSVYTRYFSVTDISTTTGLNQSGSSWLTTVVYSSALGLFIVADSNASGITQPYVTSPDALTWTRRTAPAVSGNDTINDIAASATAIVSVGSFPVIRRSTNGTTWTNVTSSNTVTFRVAYSPGLSRWVIGRGNNNGLYYSNDDGATWSTATGAAVFVANVVWNSGLSAFYVFMRNGGSVYSSSNGTSYTLAANNVLSSDNYHAACYSSDRNEMMTIGNYGAAVYTSTNGTTWTLKSTIPGSVQVVGVTWSSELYLYVACTDKGLYTSVDGTTWVAMNPLTWSGTFDYSWGRWVYSGTSHRGVAAYVNSVFRTEDTQKASLAFAASQNVQVTNDTDLRPGTGDFTIEWFQRQTTPASGTTPYVFSIANDLAVSINGTTGVVSVYVGGSAVLTNTPTNLYGRWCHMAVTRTGTTLGLFKDGVRLTTVVNSTNIANSTDVLCIGNSSTTSASNQFLGQLTNFHFVTGTALYNSSTYTVPNREIFPVANTKLLLPTPAGNIAKNFSAVSKTVTNNGATASSFNPFYL